MQTLEALTRDALALGRGEFVPAHQPTAQTDEVARVMGICNACRYCEGFCAVFPAMTRRLDFTPADAHYLANLCHNCGACLHACQYAPPHEFALNVPRAMAQVRATTYADHAWPAAFGALYRRNGAVVALALAAGLALFGLLVLALHGRLWHAPMAGDVPGNFYAVLPHGLMVALFAPVFGWAVLALWIGVGRFWRGVTPGGEVPGAAVAEAARDAVRLRYLDGGHGQGCHDADDRTTHWRRRFHHLTAGGFLLCFASTTVATLYHYALGEHAPYPVTSLPVLLGTVGGLGLLAGPAGLLWLNLQRDPLHGDPQQRPMDRAFITLLFLVSLTGLALLAGRETGAMAALLVVHLGAVMALFMTLPYGKFAHGVYRVAALVKYAVERRRPNALGLGGD